METAVAITSVCSTTVTKKKIAESEVTFWQFSFVEIPSKYNTPSSEKIILNNFCNTRYNNEEFTQTNYAQ